MALQSSGAISLANVQTEFGGSNPIGINEYYGVAAGVPASGTISLNNFYGKSAAAAFDFYSSIFGYSFASTTGAQTGNYSGNIVTPGAANSPKTFTVFLTTAYQGGSTPYNTTARYYQGGALNTTWYENRAGTYGYFHTFTFGSSTMQFTSTINDPSIYSNVSGTASVDWTTSQGAPSDRNLYFHTHGYGNGSIYSLD
jgi:hypothetical protein